MNELEKALRVAQAANWSKKKANHKHGYPSVTDFLERETGIEPATNSLEGTKELSVLYFKTLALYCQR